MWKFGNLSSGSTLWPPDLGQQQNSVNPFGCSFSANQDAPFLSLGAEGSFHHINSSFYPSFNPLTCSSEQGGDIPQTKRLLIFDHSGDQTNLVFSSVLNPFEGWNPPLPSSNTTYGAYASDSHEIEGAEMHEEDIEEIDALLYSDSEYMDDEEISTGHSPLDMVEDEITNSFPTKRRRVGTDELDASLIDTASSAIAHRSNYMQEEAENDFDPSFTLPGAQNMSRNRKCERIQHTVSVLRRIIPGGKGKDTASVLDEAIQYLKSLKLRAKSLGAAASSC